MIRTQWLRTMTAVSLMSLAAGTVLAQARGPAGHDGFGPPPGMGGPMHGGPPFGPPIEMLDQLNLTAAQRTKVASLRDESERRLIRAEADVRIAELDLRKLLDADAPDPSAVEEAIDQVGHLRTQVHKLRITTGLAIRSILTADQRAKLRNLVRSAPDRDGPDAPRHPSRP